MLLMYYSSLSARCDVFLISSFHVVKLPMNYSLLKRKHMRAYEISLLSSIIII